MVASVDLWLEYLVRLAHLVSGIAWIGSSFYFIWLDSSFLAPESPRRNVDGELFMVHGGFYYQVEKKKIYPGEVPKILHWFKWEATLTWITGFALLILLYFMKGASLLIDPQVMAIGQAEAIFFSLAFIVLSWFFYDFLWHPKFAGSKNLKSFFSVFFFAGLILALTHVFSGRGAFILTGVIFGTLMVLNVWVRILPGQAKMLKDAQDGQVPDYSLGLKSKVRSVHNTYFIFPVLLIMLSNHYPAIFNHPQKALVLVLLAISGALVRHAMVTKNSKERWTLLPAGLGLLALIFMTAKTQSSMGPQTNQPEVSFEQVSDIFETRCHSCHGSHPTDDIFKVPPKGIIFETQEQIRSFREQIYQQVVVSRAMPLANKTQMTDAERELLEKWYLATK